MSTIAIAPRSIDSRQVRRPAPGAPRPAAARPSVRPAERPSSEVRLTRRGRLVVFVGALLLVLAVGFGFGARSAATDSPEPTRVITVAPGDTLWDIAAEIAPGETRAMVGHIERLNGMDTAGLQVGQQLVVPAAG